MSATTWCGSNNKSAARLEQGPATPPSHDRGLYGNGSGVVLMDVDYESGRITSARILESTGYPKFDAAALQALRKCRFKPRTVRHVRTPITFTVAGKKL